MRTKSTAHLMREARVKKNLSQKDVGDLIGGRPQYVGAMERGVTCISINAAKKLALALGLSIEKVRAALCADFRDHVKERLR